MHEFDSAILCVPPQVVEQLVPGSIPPDVMQKILPSKAACLDVCLKKLPVPTTSFALGIDETLYYSVHSNTAQLEPNGGATIILYLGLGMVDLGFSCSPTFVYHSKIFQSR